MGGVFNKCRLGEVEKKMVVVVVEPIEGSAKEVVNFTHEVDADVVGEGLLKEELLCGVH